MEPSHYQQNGSRRQKENTDSTSTTFKTMAQLIHELPVSKTVQHPKSGLGSTDITHLSNALRRTAISPDGNNKPYEKLDSISIDPELWCEEEKSRNGFWGVDFNKGTNRDIYGAQQRIWESKGSNEERMKVQQAFKGFSLRSQLKPFNLDPEEFNGSFEKIFVGEGSKGWSRIPGSWWATRRSLLCRSDKGVLFLDTTLSETANLHDSLVAWKTMDNGLENDLKRKRAQQVSPPRRRLRDFQPSWRESEQVMSEEWRMRRRDQEKKAGRWTDGTFRIDRMWDDFHWVLDNDETRVISDGIRTSRL